MPAYEKYPMSPEASAIIKSWWPEKDKKPTPQAFLGMQRELILLHFPKMPDETKARASKTIAWIDSEVG